MASMLATCAFPIGHRNMKSQLLAKSIGKYEVRCKPNLQSSFAKSGTMVHRRFQRCILRCQLQATYKVAVIGDERGLSADHLAKVIELDKLTSTAKYNFKKGEDVDGNELAMRLSNAQIVIAAVGALKVSALLSLTDAQLIETNAPALEFAVNGISDYCPTAYVIFLTEPVAYFMKYAGKVLESKGGFMPSRHFGYSLTFDNGAIDKMIIHSYSYTQEVWLTRKLDDGTIEEFKSDTPDFYQIGCTEKLIASNKFGRSFGRLLFLIDVGAHVKRILATMKEVDNMLDQVMDDSS